MQQQQQHHQHQMTMRLFEGNEKKAANRTYDKSTSEKHKTIHFQKKPRDSFVELSSPEAVKSASLYQLGTSHVRCATVRNTQLKIHK